VLVLRVHASRGLHGDHEGKFYTHHLHPNHSNEFYDLVMGGTVNIGYPGHFYATLYLPGLKQREE
jgi:hypothetical protein